MNDMFYVPDISTTIPHRCVALLYFSYMASHMQHKYSFVQLNKKTGMLKLSLEKCF